MARKALNMLVNLFNNFLLNVIVSYLAGKKEKSLYTLSSLII